MSEFIFFVKCFALTVAIVLVMQIQVGERTVESHAMSWVHTSALVQPMNTAARGGAKVIKDLTEKVYGSVAKNSKKEKDKKEKEEAKSSSFRWSIAKPKTAEQTAASD